MCFFFFKQKTAYEMRISDWSSDVCSSDLILQKEKVMTKIFRGADGAAFAAMTTKGFEFSRDLAKEEGMDLGIVVLGDTATNPPAAVVLDIDRKSTRLNSSH